MTNTKANKLFKIPKGVSEKLERMMREFLWSGYGEEKRDHLVSWDLVCRPKVEGGFALGNVVSKNISMLGKWLWRYPLESYSLWHKVIRSKYRCQKEPMGCFYRAVHFQLEFVEGELSGFLHFLPFGYI